MAGVPIFRSQVSAIRSQERVIRFRKSVLCHRFSHRLSHLHLGWPVSAPGGRWRVFFHSALHSVLNAVLHSVLRDRLSHLHLRWPVAAPGGRWRALKLHSALHSVLNAALHSVLRDQCSPLPSVIESAIHSAAQLCRDAVPTLPEAN